MCILQVEIKYVKLKRNKAYPFAYNCSFTLHNYTYHIKLACLITGVGGGAVKMLKNDLFYIGH